MDMVIVYAVGLLVVAYFGKRFISAISGKGGCSGCGPSEKSSSGCGGCCGGDGAQEHSSSK